MIKKLNVVVSDGDLNFRTIAKKKLIARGYRVITSSNPIKTFSILRNFKCDAILINYQSDEERGVVSQYLKTKKIIILNEV